MPRAYLSFDLEDPNEQEKFKMAQIGARYQFVLQDLDNHLRNIYKHGETKKVDRSTFAQEIREKLHELLSDDGLDLM